MESKVDRAKRFAEIWWKSRAEAGKTIEYMALGLGVSKKTIQNWEKGLTSPTFLQGEEWFSLLGLSPMPYYMTFWYPDAFTRLKANDNEKKIEAAFNILMQNLSIQAKRQLLYLFYGEHGSSASAVLHLLMAHLHVPMKERYIHADVILNNYQMSKALGTIVCPDNIQPNEELLEKAIECGKQAAIQNKSGYVETNK